MYNRVEKGRITIHVVENQKMLQYQNWYKKSMLWPLQTYKCKVADLDQSADVATESI